MPGGLSMKDINAIVTEQAILYGDWEVFLDAMIND